MRLSEFASKDHDLQSAARDRGCRLHKHDAIQGRVQMATYHQFESSFLAGREDEVTLEGNVAAVRSKPVGTSILQS